MGIFEFIYYTGYAAKKNYWLKNQKRLPHPVISVGNITTGGTGKTPCVVALAEEAKRRGFSPVILTRGYKGKAKGPCFVLPSTSGLVNRRTSALDFGDEPVLMAERLKDVPIVKCADRYKGGLFAIAQLSAISYQPSAKILFILDDGFQHWKLFRDRDILLIDAEDPFDNRSLLPIGLLREPLKEMKRADAIVITKTDGIRKEAIESLTDEIKKYNPGAPVFLSGHRPSGYTNISGEEMSLESLKGKKAYAFCGIGNPESFRKTLILSGAELTGLKAYKDHYVFKQGDLDGILSASKKSDAGFIVTTEKDMARLKGLRLPSNLISLKIEFSAEEEFYEEAFKTLTSSRG